MKRDEQYQLAIQLPHNIHSNIQNMKTEHRVSTLIVHNCPSHSQKCNTKLQRKVNLCTYHRCMWSYWRGHLGLILTLVSRLKWKFKWKSGGEGRTPLEAAQTHCRFVMWLFLCLQCSSCVDHQWTYWRRKMALKRQTAVISSLFLLIYTSEWCLVILFLFLCLHISFLDWYDDYMMMWWWHWCLDELLQ